MWSQNRYCTEDARHISQAGRQTRALEQVKLLSTGDPGAASADPWTVEATLTHRSEQLHTPRSTKVSSSGIVRR